VTTGSTCIRRRGEAERHWGKVKKNGPSTTKLTKWVDLTRRKTSETREHEGGSIPREKGERSSSKIPLMERGGVRVSHAWKNIDIAGNTRRHRKKCGEKRRLAAPPKKNRGAMEKKKQS